MKKRQKRTLQITNTRKHKSLFTIFDAKSCFVKGNSVATLVFALCGKIQKTTIYIC